MKFLKIAQKGKSHLMLSEEKRLKREATELMRRNEESKRKGLIRDLQQEGCIFERTTSWIRR